MVSFALGAANAPLRGWLTVRQVEVDDVVENVYAATNPVTADLVTRVQHWPGVNTLRALLEKRTIVVRRPRCFLSEDMPEEVTLTCAIPPEFCDADAILARIFVVPTPLG